MPSQEITGKAFEFACIKALFDKLSSQTDVELLEDVNFNNTKSAFEQLTEAEKQDDLLAALRGIEIIAPSGKFCIAIPIANVNAPITVKVVLPEYAPAKTTPTAIPSGMYSPYPLWR